MDPCFIIVFLGILDNLISVADLSICQKEDPLLNVLEGRRHLYLRDCMLERSEDVGAAEVGSEAVNLFLGLLQCRVIVGPDHVVALVGESH